MRLPEWIRDELRRGGGLRPPRALTVSLRAHRLHTVCEEARCPNKGDCFRRQTATFLILGRHCTRSCRFCAVAQGPLDPPDPEEPVRVAAAALDMGLRYAVVTSVTRDDLADGGAGQFTATAWALRARIPEIRIEFLTPDFAGKVGAAETVLASAPEVFNHNLETVPRLYSSVRPGASYDRSLKLLSVAAMGKTRVKSGIMIGLGETVPEVESVLRDMRTAGCTIVTIGQYLRPGKDKLPVYEYVHPEQFVRYAETARLLGFSAVASAPLVRSSMNAEELSNV